MESITGLCCVGRLWAVLHLLNKDELAQPIAGVDLGLTFMLAVIKGTTGPNRYGPDPLGGHLI